MKIPKIIHYCWFGNGQLSAMEQKCIASWKKYCPEYTFMEWNESNYDVSQCTYTKEAAQAGKWGFVTDYVRLDVLYQYGGFYFDTDVEFLKPLDDLCTNTAFIGFEQNDRVNDGQGIGAVPHLDMIRGLRDMYFSLHFCNEDGSLNLVECPQYRTQYLMEKGLVLNGQAQTIGEMTIYPQDYFCPKSFQTGLIKVTSNTYSIHHFRGSWHTEKERKMIGRMQVVRRILGEKLGNRLLRWFFDTKDNILHKK
ncbi:MAG: glycosyltransferase [Lachnospiraceae bacterium]|nr:glycosyltransferase [Lachnospiraceae bacterium]